MASPTPLLALGFSLTLLAPLALGGGTDPFDAFNLGGFDLPPNDVFHPEANPCGCAFPPLDISTGITDGTPVDPGNGIPDDEWVVAATPYDAGPIADPAYVIWSDGAPWADIPGSRWINMNPTWIGPLGTITYAYEFTLPAGNIAAATLSADFVVDDRARFLLNGVQINPDLGDWNIVTSFSYSGPAFQNGLNRLEVEVINLRSITGLTIVGEVKLCDEFPDPETRARAWGVHGHLGWPVNGPLQVSHVQAGPGTGQAYDLESHVDVQPIPLPPLDNVQALADGLNVGARTSNPPVSIPAPPGTMLFARGNSTIEEVDLLGGLIHAEGLHAVVESRTMVDGSWTDLDMSESSFGRLWIGGQEVVDTTPNLAIPLPGGQGYVILQEERTVQRGNHSSEGLVAMIHVLLDTGGLSWSHIYVGTAYAGTSCKPPLGEVFTNDPVIPGLPVQPFPWPEFP